MDDVKGVPNEHSFQYSFSLTIK